MKTIIVKLEILEHQIKDLINGKTKSISIAGCVQGTITKEPNTCDKCKQEIKD